ncbi:hypothetical protein OS175_13525 [Marinicella sp. S1101]|uniref:hypothetical protein n=1 Tax=Marinicella marina TaxID=2996016 RepID=UPI0022609C8A|nr:hypothetical protein [Marinicella marina]MCX7554894.1 hypothetical protein [Marinicella marina]MDJ1141282.1 hypothetical protein [Marinicella marina]
MTVLFVLAVFMIDMVVHYYTIQWWGWLQTFWVNLLVIFIGWLLFMWRKPSLKFQRGKELHSQYSKKKIKKLDHISKNNPDKLTAQDKEYISIGTSMALASFGFVLVLFPGLLSGFIGMVLMIVGFIGAQVLPPSE